MNYADMLAAWSFAFFSLAILSYLWKVNYVYRIAETFSVAALTAHTLVTTYTGSIEGPCLNQILSGNVIRIAPLIFGLLVFTRLSRTYGWISRYSTSLLAGVGTGVLFGTTFDAQILTQIAMTASAFVNQTPLNAFIIFISVFTVLSYFIYTHEHEGPLGISAKIGRVLAMLSFGLNYSAELIWYLTLVVGIFIKLIDEWIKGAILGI